MLFKPGKCFLCFLKLDVENDKKGKEKALTLWINPAEWMYCSTGGGVGQEDGGGERGHKGRQGSTVQFTILAPA